MAKITQTTKSHPKPKANAKPKAKTKVATPPPAFDFGALEVAIREAARLAFIEVTAAHPEETLCAFALYSDDGAMTVCPSINTVEHLAARRLADPSDAALCKFSTPEWRYEMQGADQAFAAISGQVREHVFTLRNAKPSLFTNFRKALFETCLRVLEQLRTSRCSRESSSCSVSRTTIRPRRPSWRG